jgi:hypothetical protein
MRKKRPLASSSSALFFWPGGRRVAWWALLWRVEARRGAKRGEFENLDWRVRRALPEVTPEGLDMAGIVSSKVLE